MISGIGEQNTTRRGFSTTSSSNTGSDGAITVVQNSHGFVLGQAVYFDTGVNYWRKALADSNAVTYDTFALAIISDYIGVNSFKVETVADITPTNLSLVVQSTLTLANGDAIWLSQTEQGKYTNIEPTAGFSQHLGFYENGNIHFYPKLPSNLDVLASPVGSVKTRILETADYKLIETVKGCDIDIYVRLKENSLGAKNFSVPIVTAGVYKSFHLLRYKQEIETKNLALAINASAYQGPVLNFNKLLFDGYQEDFGVLGVGGAIGTHAVLDNGSYYSNNNAGDGYTRYFSNLLIPQVGVQGIDMSVNYADNCISQIGLCFNGTVTPL
jgi:hypothetical protein